MMHSDVAGKLRSAVSDAHKGTGDYAHYVDHSGDGESGDVIYSLNNGMKKAPYEVSSVGGKSATNVDTGSAVDVSPCVSYDELADDDDHYASMEEAGLYTKGPIPVCERFISKGERASADEGSFAGKGKSFLIRQPSDVGAAVHAMGRAGSNNLGLAALKANIIKIAKAKGFTSELPKTWRGDDSASKESTVSTAARGTLALVESQDWKEQALDLIEASGSPVRMKIKLIAPGKGSSAFYPAEVLKRDGPKVFTKGTHIYINHATSAEESARPEGDWHKLAGALDGNAYWDESAKQGPGLYGDALFTSDHAPMIREKAPFTGMSIRASGVAESGKKHGNLPILKELTHAESVDVVTRAGAGGMILTESARAGNPQEVEMTAEEINALVESAVKTAVAAVQAPVVSLTERALKGDAMVAANKILRPLSLNEAAKQMVVENVLERGVPQTDGVLDEAKLTEAINAEAKRVGAVIGASSGSGRVFGMGASTAVMEAVKPPTPAETEADKVNTFKRLGLSEAAATRAAKGRAA